MSTASITKARNGSVVVSRSGSIAGVLYENENSTRRHIPKLNNRILSSPSLTRRVSEPEKESPLDSKTNNVINKSPSVPELASQHCKDSVSVTGDDRRVNSVVNFRRGTRSQWSKLRSAVQSVAVVRSEVKKRKMGELQREDSFLRRFSTRSCARRSFGSTADSVEDGQLSYTYPEETTSKDTITIWSVFRPDGTTMFYWMWLVTIAVFYNLWVIIVREAFRELQDGSEMLWIFVDLLADIVYILDIGVQVRTGYLEQGLIVFESIKLAKRYLHSSAFFLDILSVLPFDFIQFKIGIHPMVRFNRFIKVYRIFRFMYMMESRTSFPNLFRVMNLMHILFLGCHWFAGFYYMISKAENFNNKWTYPTPNGTYASVSRKYLMSMYWSTLTLTTIGDLHTPYENIEYLFVIVSYLIGVFVFATIVGQVGSVITNRNSRRQDFERLVDSAKTYMRRHNVPKDMRKRVMRWYDYVWTRGRIDGKWDINTLGLLPDKLKTELAIHVNLHTLRKVTIFQECQPEFLHDLVLKMKAYIFTPGDVICRYGEVAREMFIIADGVVEVISDTGTVLTRMNPGDFFGEIGILNLDGGINRRTADVRSVGYSELFVLSRDDVLSALKDHPDAEAILKEYGRKRLDAIRKLTTYPSPTPEMENKLSEPEPKRIDQSDALLISDADRRQSLSRSFSTSCIKEFSNRHIQVELMRSLEGCSVTKSPTKRVNAPPVTLIQNPLRTQELIQSMMQGTKDDAGIPSIVIEPASPDKERAPTNGTGGLITAVDCAVAAVKDILLDRWKEHENTFRSVIKVLENERTMRESVIAKMQTQIDSLQSEVSRLKKSDQASTRSTKPISSSSHRTKNNIEQEGNNPPTAV